MPKSWKCSIVNMYGNTSVKEFIEVPEKDGFISTSGAPATMSIATDGYTKGTDYFTREEAREIWIELADNGYTEVKDGPTLPLSFMGAQVVFTGFRDSAAETYIESKGGYVTRNVNLGTTMVFAKDPTRKTKKVQSAIDWDIPIFSQDNLKEMIV